MKILVIDSHKGTASKDQSNLHWLNGKIIADSLNAKYIWSYPSVNDNVESDFDLIIFNHASPYSYVDYAWLEASPNARLVYITNEVNLGEPRILWMAAKAGRKYDVIANHPAKASKVVKKYVNNWDIVNLNSLIFDPKSNDSQLADINFIDFGDDVDEYDTLYKRGIVYYGSFRKDRIPSFKRLLTKDITLSTHSKNVSKFEDCGVRCKVVKRINWKNDGDGLNDYLASLYIEDEKTRIYYNFLANRFYESLNYNCVPLFDYKCTNTMSKCLYDIPDDFIIKDSSDIKEKLELISNNKLTIPNEWFDIAFKEKESTINEIIKLCVRQ